MRAMEQQFSLPLPGYEEEPRRRPGLQEHDAQSNTQIFSGIDLPSTTAPGARSEILARVPRWKKLPARMNGSTHKINSQKRNETERAAAEPQPAEFQQQRENQEERQQVADGDEVNFPGIGERPRTLHQAKRAAATAASASASETALPEKIAPRFLMPRRNAFKRTLSGCGLAAARMINASNIVPQ